MIKAYRYLVLATVAVQVVLGVLPGVWGLAEGSLIICLSVFVGVGLVKFFPIARLIYLLVLISVVVVITYTPEHRFHIGGPGSWRLVVAPVTEIFENILLSLNAAILFVSYLTPVSANFQENKILDRLRTRSLWHKAVLTEGAAIAALTAVILLGAVYHQSEFRNEYSSRLPESKIENAKVALETAEIVGIAWRTARAVDVLGDAYWDDGQREKAVAMYMDVLSRAKAHEQERPEGSNLPRVFVGGAIVKLARYHASAPDSEFGDGGEALKWIKLARFKPWRWGPDLPHDVLTSLAMVHARLGQFEKAIETQKLAILALAEDAYRGDLREYSIRIQAYEDNKPWRHEYLVSGVY